MSSTDVKVLDGFRETWQGGLLLLVAGVLLSASLGGVIIDIYLNAQGIESVKLLMDSLDSSADKSVLQTIKIVQAVLHLSTYTIPVLLVAVILYGKATPKQLGLEAVPNVTTTLKGIALMFTLFPLIGFIYYWNTSLLPESWIAKDTLNLEELLMQNQTIKELVINFTVFAIFAGLGEELLFRGMLQRLLYEANANKHFAVWVTALLFSLIHFQPEGFVPRFMLGGVLGYLFLYAGNLWVPIIVHIAFNGSQIIVKYFDTSDTASKMNEVSQVPFLSVLVGTVLSFFIFRSLYKNRTEPIHQEL